MADPEHDDGGDPHARLEEATVDDSQLKVPVFSWEGTQQEVKSGEEDEDVLFKQKAKLFRYTGGEWKERGTGPIKLLKHRATGKVRLVMRQDKTLKVCANHAVDPATVLVPMPGADRARMWIARDFAEGDAKDEKFSARFKDSDEAASFEAAWDEARAINAAGGKPGAAGSSPAKGGAASSAAPAPAAAAAAPAAAAPAAAAPAAADVSGPIPVFDSLDTLYGAGEPGSNAAIRYGKLTEAFKEEFGGVEPTVYVRAPGRVNLIGEHIDYHGYSVLPMALQQDVVIAVSVGEPGGPVRVANLNRAKHASATIPADPAAPVDQSTGVHWQQYVQCGYKGAFDVAKAKGTPLTPRGLLIMVDGQVPPGAGVSSSSALTVASLLAVARAHGLDAKMTRAELGEGGRACELYIGTMSGGMDQAISSMANAGSAARIDFEPLSAHTVSLPAGAAFVVSNSLEESAKAVDSEKRYNRRVTEGKLAAKLIAKGEGLPGWAGVQTFRQLQGLLGLETPGLIVPLVAKHLRNGGYSLADVAAQAGAEAATLFEGDGKRVGALKVVSSLGAADKELMLAERARHVCSESDRVYAFEAACKGTHLDGRPIEGGPAGQLAAIGALMSASHTSCRDDYQCSSPGLDELVALAIKSGAAGARLTGAGWGGCSVSLVQADKVDAFLAAMKAGYYDKKGLSVASALWASAPGSGAAVFTPPASFEI